MSAVEFALVLPVLVLLLLGTFSAGLALHRQLSLDHAAREGARFGATLDVQAPGGTAEWNDQLDQVIERTRETAVGELDANVEGRFICAAFLEAQAGVGDGIRRHEGTLPSNVPDDRCFDDNRSEHRIQVLVGRSTEFDLVFVRFTVDLDSTALARYESEPDGSS